MGYRPPGGEPWIVEVNRKMNEFRRLQEEEKRAVKKSMLSGQDITSWFA
jgi:hypothetical protein